MEVEHDEAKQKFVINLGDGSEALLAYRKQGDILELYHTFVPEPHRGEGVAEKIVVEAFRYAKQKKLKVIPSCPYISGTFLKRHEEFRGLVAQDR